MLVRFVVKNLFSFDGLKEFNSIPNNRLSSLPHHKYLFDEVNLLKVASVYGANGSGKSNLVKSLAALQGIVTEPEEAYNLKALKFKFDDNEKSQILAAEFFQDDTFFYYALELMNGTILTEELYISGMGKCNDKLIFERKTDNNRETAIKFSDEFERDEKSMLLKDIILEEFVKYNEPILKTLSEKKNKFLIETKKAYSWFKESLQIIIPRSKPSRLPLRLNSDNEFSRYAKDIMCSFNIGVTGLVSDKKDIHNFFGENDPEGITEIVKDVESSETGMISLINSNRNEIVIAKEDDNIIVYSLKVEHTGKNNMTALFDLDEESDGTNRLLDFIPVFQDLTSKKKVYVIDEVERSIHPLLIKELVRKFSLDKETHGQLIFTTHESNLLDQEIFRRDEIWFAEKDRDGITDLYSLNDFNEHITKDISNGYLSGRYGAIPFLGNLKDLNWNDYDTQG